MNKDQSYPDFIKSNFKVFSDLNLGVVYVPDGESIGAKQWKEYERQKREHQLVVGISFTHMLTKMFWQEGPCEENQIIGLA